MEILPQNNGVYELLLESLIPHLEEKGRHWLQETLTDDGLPSVVDRRMAAARRKVGHQEVQLSLPFEYLSLSGTSHPLPGRFWETMGWDVSEVARMVILLKCQYGSSQREDLVKEAFRRGGEKERSAIMKGMLLLDGGGHLRSMVVDTCRTNSLELFASVAVGNPYPYLYFEEPEFNQMVLKALFMEMDIARIYALENRITETLSRMGKDFFEERKAAGRSVPASIRMIL